MSSSVRYYIVGTMLGLSVACGSFDRGEPTPPDDTGGDAAGDGDGGTALSFAADVYPILTAHCGSCHSSGGIGASSAFHLSASASADYATVVTLVSTSAPESSELLQRASGVSHSGGAVLSTSSAEYQLIDKWIAQGAPQ